MTRTDQQTANRILDQILAEISRIEKTYRAGDTAKILCQSLRTLLGEERQHDPSRTVDSEPV